MPSITITKDEALDILDNEKIHIRDKTIGKSRWAIQHQLIFSRDGKLYRANYQVGATEQQDEMPWEYEKEVVCVEVVGYEKTIVDYKDVED